MDKCWCGEELIERSWADRVSDEVCYHTVCPKHDGNWHRPPDGLVPALVEAVEAADALAEHEAECVLCFGADNPCDRACELMAERTRTQLTALALLDRPREEVQDAE